MARRFLLTLIAFACGTLLFADEPSHYVREVVLPESGNTLQAVLTFKDKQLNVQFVECGYTSANQVKSIRFEFVCRYHEASDGYVTGRVIGVEMDLKGAPQELGINVESLKGLNKLYGEPFCFRVEAGEKELTVADLRLPLPEGFTSDAKAIRETLTACLGGTYKRTDSAKVPLPKMEKPRNAATAWLTMPRKASVELVPTRPKQTIIPTAADLAPPGTLKNDSLLPMIADGWKQSTAPVESTKIPPLNVPAEQPKPGLIPPLAAPKNPPAKGETIPPAK